MAAAISEAVKAFKVDFTVRHDTELGSIQQLPSSYTWSEGHSKQDPDRVEEPLPVIDLTLPNATEQMVEACRKWGLFIVTNHGVPVSLLDEMEAAARSVFTLPVEQKMRAARPSNGLSGFGRHRSSKFFDKIMWSEGFTIVGSPEEHARKLWPDDFDKFCETTENYKAAMSELSGRLMWLLLGSLGITKEDIDWIRPDGGFTKETTPVVQLNSYPPCPEPDKAVGLGHHTDTTLINVVYQGGVSGLQVHRDESGWVTVPAIPGALAVNVGDLLHIFSNGTYPSALHRVLPNRSQHRVSLTYLHGPPEDIQIAPFPKLVGPDRPARYRAVSWSEYLGTKQKYFNEALAAIRI